MGKKDKRFMVVSKEDGLTISSKIIVDKETGVHYLFYKEGYAGSITPLLDRDGKVIVKNYDEYEY